MASAGAVAWYENDGSESFAAHTMDASPAGFYSVFAIDVDGDGDSDALTASTTFDTVAWYENACEPAPVPTTFCTAVAFSTRIVTTLADNARSVFAIDVDGDGDVDVLSASKADHTVAWYENDGSQSFTERVVEANAEFAWSVYAIDGDGDGDVDVLSASYQDDTIACYENDGAQSGTGVFAVLFLHHSGSTGPSRSTS